MRPLHKLSLLVISLAILLVLIATPLRAQTPDAPITLAEYRAELEAAIAQLDATPIKEVNAAIEALQDRFATITQIELGNGDLIEIQPLLEDIDLAIWEDWDGETPPLSPRYFVLARLRGALAQIDAAPNDNTQARLAILEEILARPEFNTPMSLWDRFWQWLENLISQWWPDSQSSAGSGFLAALLRLVPWIIAIIIVAAILWLLVYWLQRLLRNFVTDARLAELAGDDDLPRSAAEARQQAHAAAQSGLYRDAVRRLYLAALLQLSEHDLITYERSLTNREVLIRVPNDSPIRAHLGPVVATFDQVWYGVREPDQATFNAYEQEIDTLAAVARRAADPVERGQA